MTIPVKNPAKAQEEDDEVDRRAVHSVAMGMKCSIVVLKLFFLTMLESGAPLSSTAKWT